MKKILLLIALAFCANASYGQVTDKPYRAGFKESFVENCYSPYKDLDAPTAAAAKNYCNCAAERLLDKLTKEQLTKMLEMTEDQKAELMMPIIQPCIEEAKKALEAKENKK